VVRGAFGVEAPARPAFLLFVTLLPAPPFAVDFLLKLGQPCQVHVAPKPHGPAVTYAQLGGLNPFGHNPAVQGHYRNARCFGGLLRITRLCHDVIYIAYLSLLVKLLLWPIGPGKLARLLLRTVLGNSWQVVRRLRDLRYRLAIFTNNHR
jgi:hypothetical protein